MRARVVIFPFDLFGSAGTARGAELLGDALREMIADNRREPGPARCTAYSDRVVFQEFAFAELADYEDWIAAARKVVRRAIKNGEFLVWLSGNHLGVLPVYEQLAAAPDTLVLQFDAHLDAYNLADCVETLTHGNFLLHAEALPAVVNVGHRDLFLPGDHVGRHFREAIPAWRPLPTPGGAGRVFIDIDCDVFDPAYFPAVNQALPFGMSPREVLSVMDGLDWGRVGGVCVSEFDPARDERDRSLGTLVWLLEWVLLRKYEPGS